MIRLQAITHFAVIQSSWPFKGHKRPLLNRSLSRTTEVVTPAPLFCPLYRFDLLVLPPHSTSSPSSSATMLHVKSEMGFGAQSAEKHASSSVTASASMVVVQKKLQYSGESSKSEYQVSLL